MDFNSMGVMAGSLGIVGAIAYLSRRSSASRSEETGDLLSSRKLRTMGRFANLKSFQTEKGSTYEVLESRPHMLGTDDDYGVDLIRANAPTRRTKSQHTYHDPKDVGLKEPSHWTVYVSPKDALRLGWHVNAQGLDDAGVWVDGDYLRYVSKTRDRSWGITEEDRKNPIPYGTYPMVGLAPVELWRPEEVQFSGRKNAVFKKYHAGNAIVSVNPPHPTLGG